MKNGAARRDRTGRAGPPPDPGPQTFPSLLLHIVISHQSLYNKTTSLIPEKEDAPIGKNRALASREERLYASRGGVMDKEAFVTAVRNRNIRRHRKADDTGNGPDYGENSGCYFESDRKYKK